MSDDRETRKDTKILQEKGLIPKSAALMDQGVILPSITPRNTVLEKPEPMSHDRITVVETISFASPEGIRVRPVESRYWRPLKHGGDSPYQRSFKITETPTPLDIGWAREWPKIGLIHVSNDEGRRLQTLPTQAEKDELAKKIVKLDKWLILPGESMRGLPEDVSQLLISSLHGSIRITVTVYPG
jgi:hypothetical protein